MELKIGTKQILNILHVLSWIIFIGLCVEAGAVVVNIFITILVNPADAGKFWREIDLSGLYKYDPGHFLVMALFITIAAIMKAITFYLIVKFLYEKKLNLSQPFSSELKRFISGMSYLAFGIGLFSWWGGKYSEWLVQQGMQMPDVQYLRLGGADVWLFMSVILFVIAQILKRGIEIQSENELTV